jgi:hypothetical protein
MRSLVSIVAVGALASVAPLALADDLYNNGPFITNPTGGTGTIAGLPISNPDPFTFPGVTGTFYTTGVAATVATATASAEDFTVPPGQMWNLDSVTLYAFQTSQTTATVHHIQINLWTAPPFDAGSPPPLPNPLPTPLLATPLILATNGGTFVCHREGSATSTSTVRPVFAYTVPLTDLPNGGHLMPGTYWLEWSFDGALSPSNNVFQPLISPRTARSGWNARLKNTLSGNSTDPRVWFEGREGYEAGVSDGRAYELPFILHGTSTPLSVCETVDFNCDGDIGTDADIESFFACLAGTCPPPPCTNNADFNGDGDIGTDADIESFFRVLAGGPC